MQLDDEKFHRLKIVRPGFIGRRLLRRPTLDRALYDDAGLTETERSHLVEVTHSAQRVFERKRLLFIFGIMPRSGTNFLFELLLRAPPFARSAIPFAELPILAGEEYFRGPVDLIGRVHRESGKAFARMEWMAYATAGFRNRVLDIAGPGSITLIKNPLVWNIELWPVLFPQDHMLLLIRDARYIVDSFMRTLIHSGMSRTFEDVCIETALAIDKSMAFLASQPANRLMLLRYEDVVRDKSGAVSRVSEWLGESTAIADREVLEHLPVYGSSVYSNRTSDGSVDWTPVAADEGFDPTNRTLSWTTGQQRIFDRVCGAQNARLGYGR